MQDLPNGGGADPSIGPPGAGDPRYATGTRPSYIPGIGLIISLSPAQLF